MNAAKRAPSLAISISIPHHPAGARERAARAAETCSAPTAAVVRGTSPSLAPPLTYSVISRLLRLLRMPAEEGDQAADREEGGDTELLEDERTEHEQHREREQHGPRRVV